MASTTPSYSEPSYAKKETPQKLPWYRENIDKYLLPQVQELLESYSKIPRNEQSLHVHTIRDQSWAVSTYPITGLGVFLVPYLSYSPALSEVADRLKAGETFLDVGCYLGGDMRFLVHKGAPSDKMYGVDILDQWNIGFDMFRDRDSFKAHFVKADITSADAEALQPLRGEMDIISLSAVLHQWGWDDSVKALKQIVTFSKPGTLLVGHQTGNHTAMARKMAPHMPETWRHSPASFETMVNQVAEETQTTWETKVWEKSWKELDWDPNDMTFFEEGACVIEFVLTRTK